LLRIESANLKVIDQLAEINHRIILRYGNPAEQIIAAAIELCAELVVMATHGCMGMSRLFFGSVAEKVVRELSCRCSRSEMGFLQAKPS